MKLPRWIGPGAIAFLVLWLLLLAAGRSSFLRDPGTFWHTTTGELILSNGFIRTDPYTFTFAGTWWVPYQWLGEVALAFAHRVGGFDTQLLGAVTIIAAVFAWLFVKLLRTGMHPVIAGAIVAMGLASASAHFHVRPHLFTIACTALTVVLLCEIDSSRFRPRAALLLPPLFVLWTNVHGGVLGGIATVGIVVTGWVAFRALGWWSPIQNGRDAILFIVVTVACGLATLANPYGTDLLKTWLVIMGEPALKQIIQEHRPFDPREPSGWPVIAFAALYLFVLVGVTRHMRVTWLLPLVWMAMAFDRVRHAPLFVVVGLVVIASMWPATRWAAWLTRNRPDLQTSPGEVPHSPVWANLWLPVVAVLLALTLQVARVPIPVIGSGWARHDPKQWPVELLDALKENEPHSPGQGNHLFNDYLDGGFVIYHAPGYKVFVDDRCEVFGGAWLMEFVNAYGTDTAGAIARWEGAYGRFNFALTRTGTAFDDYFKSASGWVLVKKTETASFYKRK